jgi:chromosome segregation ATPase
MNIDDRLEALTQSLELLSSMRRDSEKRMEQATQNVDRLSENVDRQSKNVDRLSLATERNTQGKRAAGGPRDSDCRRNRTTPARCRSSRTPH